MQAIAPVLIENSGISLKYLELNYIFNSKQLDQGLQALTPLLPQLHTFEILWHDMTDENFYLIASRLSQIKKLYMHAYKDDTQLTSEGIVKAFTILAERCLNIKEIGLAGDILDLIGNREDIEQLPYAFKTLEILDLREISSNMFQLSHLTGFIKSNPNLREINVKGLVSEGDIDQFLKEHEIVKQRNINFIF